MNPLLQQIETNSDRLRARWLRITEAQWLNLLARLAAFVVRAEKSARDGKALECYDEQIWTFLVATGYAVGDEPGAASLCRMIGGDSNLPATPLWMEALPMPPRLREGNTNLDLACGGIRSRGIVGEDGKLGIAYDSSADHIVFCEMKWYSDISKSVTHDQRRNQLARVIENALAFQDGARLAASCTVTLVTPAIFRDSGTKSRLYHYKYEEYARPETLLAEWRDCDLVMPPRRQRDWCYPEDIADRAGRLRLHWVTYEELIEGMPESPLGVEIRRFHSLYNRSSPARA